MCTSETVLVFCLAVAVASIVFLWIFCLRQKFIINELYEQLQALREERVTASKKIENARISLQALERNLQNLRKDLAEK